MQFLNRKQIGDLRRGMDEGCTLNFFVTKTYKACAQIKNNDNRGVEISIKILYSSHFQYLYNLVFFSIIMDSAKKFFIIYFILNSFLSIWSHIKLLKRVHPSENILSLDG